MNIGKKIKYYRENRKMTQREISEILGVEAATISKYESNTIVPSIESLKSLADIFGISVDDLIRDEETIDIDKLNILQILREQKEIRLKGNLYHNTQIIFAYNTNHIEGSRLSEDQTRNIFETNTILFDGDMIANVDDILETANHFKLVDYMLDIAEENITENMIKEFHRILKAGTMDSTKTWFNVGEYKKLSNEAGSIKTVEPKFVQRDMTRLIDWYNSLKQVTLKEIIEFHAKFEKIHPFQDGNGRIGRIILFKECLKNNIIPFIILDKYKMFYYRGLKEYQTNKEKGFLIDTCLHAQDYYKSMIKYYLKDY